MNSRLLHGIQKMASKEGSPNTVGGFLNQAMAEKSGAETENAQVVTEKVKSSNTTPSSASGKGMEDRNKGYGHAAVDTDFDKKEKSKDETGEVQNRSAGAHPTTEAKGIPDTSLKKSAAEEKLATDIRASRIRERLGAHMTAFGG